MAKNIFAKISFKIYFHIIYIYYYKINVFIIFTKYTYINIFSTNIFLAIFLYIFENIFSNFYIYIYKLFTKTRPPLVMSIKPCRSHTTTRQVTSGIKQSFEMLLFLNKFKQ